MGSKRDKLKKLNQTSKPIEPKEEPTTIVDELIQNYENTENEENNKSDSTNDSVFLSEIPEDIKRYVEAKDNEVKPVEEIKPVIQGSSILVDVMDKSNVGRPKTWGAYKNISARLKMENYEFARSVSGIYGGMIGYINWLIEEDRKRREQ